ncbi:hypothetical protein [Streptomyces cucumeris]|uniref:hypothetical protein n=1 Tax=Streptomyces cucumeris TaxID=2962890 RepID=UPI003D721B80
MTVFYCCHCAYELTPDLVALPAVPEAPTDDRDRDRKTGLAPSTVPRGHYAVAPGDGDARGPVVMHPEDAPALRPLPGGENAAGCCGPTGREGPNRACPCGVRLATLAADCLGPYELRVDPVRSYAFDG